MHKELSCKQATMATKIKEIGNRNLDNQKYYTNSVRNACLLRPSSAVNAASSTRER